MLGHLFSVNWQGMFMPQQSPLESFVRISIVYLFIFFLLRFTMKREAAAMSISDLLVLVLIADASQNAMAGNYHNIPDGLVLAGTLVFWNWVLTYSSSRWSRVRRIVHPAPLLLVKDGKPIVRNMRKEQLNMDELMGYLRLEGVEKVDEVKSAYMEENGQISVIRKDRQRTHPPEQHKAA